MIRTAGIFLWGLLLLLFITGNRCNYSDMPTITNSKLTQTQSNDTIYQLTKRFFLLFPGDTALLYGTRTCTTITDGDASMYNESLYLRTITLHPYFMWINKTKHLVFPQVYQQNSSYDSLARNSVIRYFEIEDTAIMQLACKENGVMHYFEKNRQKVIPITIEVGYFDTVESSKNKWPASPLIQNPVSIAQGSIWFTGHSLAKKGLALNWGQYYLVNGYEYQVGVRLKTYHSISGNGIEDNKSVSYLGTVIVTRSYFKDIGLVDQKMTSIIFKKFSDGTEIIIKEHIILERGPEGAKVYNDWEIPDQ